MWSNKNIALNEMIAYPLIICLPLWPFLGWPSALMSAHSPAGSINKQRFKITWSSADAQRLREVMETTFNTKGKKMVLSL